MALGRTAWSLIGLGVAGALTYGGYALRSSGYEKKEAEIRTAEEERKKIPTPSEFFPKHRLKVRTDWEAIGSFGSRKETMHHSDHEYSGDVQRKGLFVPCNEDDPTLQSGTSPRSYVLWFYNEKDGDKFIAMQRNYRYQHPDAGHMFIRLDWRRAYDPLNFNPWGKGWQRPVEPAEIDITIDGKSNTGRGIAIYEMADSSGEDFVTLDIQVSGKDKKDVVFRTRSSVLASSSVPAEPSPLSTRTTGSISVITREVEDELYRDIDAKLDADPDYRAYRTEYQEHLKAKIRTKIKTRITKKLSMSAEDITIMIEEGKKELMEGYELLERVGDRAIEEIFPRSPRSPRIP